MMWQPTLPGLDLPRDIPSGRLGDIYKALPPEERAPYMDALHDRSITAEALSGALAQMGFTASSSLIRTYRRLHVRA